MEFAGFVLAASTADPSEEPAAREHADALEYRMDLADDPLDALRRYDGTLPILATNRAAWEGGEAGDDEARLDALAAAVELDPVEAIDVELRSLTEGDGERAVERAQAEGVAVVVSVHDFQGTPPQDGLRDLLFAACSHGDVGKLAVTAESRQDVLDLLAITDEFASRGERVATMAMGEAGRHSRAVAPLYGSRIGYAPVESTGATAPGQYDLATLARLVAELRG